MKIIKIGVLCWRPMVVGDSIIFAVFVNFFKDLNKITKTLNIQYKLVFFVNEVSVAIPSLFYKKYIEEGLLEIVPHKFGKFIKVDKDLLGHIKNFFSLVKSIRSFKCDVFFNSRTNSQGFWLVCLLSGAKKIAGLSNAIVKGRGSLESKRISKIHRARKTITDIKEVILPFCPMPYIDINKIEARKIELAEGLFTPHKFEKPTIGIFVGASNRDKVLHPSEMAKVVAFLHQNYSNNFDIAIFGSGDMELDLFNQLQTELTKLGVPPSAYINFINKTNLHKAIEYCGGLSLAITNDSGFMHVASLFNTPTISFFGYTPAIHFMSQIFNEAPFLGLQSTLPCSPCLTPGACPFKHETPQHFRKCLTQNITPQLPQIKLFVDSLNMH